MFVNNNEKENLQRIIIGLDDSVYMVWEIYTNPSGLWMLVDSGAMYT
jgi:hypothetical protein